MMSWWEVTTSMIPKNHSSQQCVDEFDLSLGVIFSSNVSSNRFSKSDTIVIFFFPIFLFSFKSSSAFSIQIPSTLHSFIFVHLRFEEPMGGTGSGDEDSIFTIIRSFSYGDLTILWTLPSKFSKWGIIKSMIALATNHCSWLHSIFQNFGLFAKYKWVLHSKRQKLGLYNLDLTFLVNYVTHGEWISWFRYIMKFWMKLQWAAMSCDELRWAVCLLGCVVYLGKSVLYS